MTTVLNECLSSKSETVLVIHYNTFGLATEQKLVLQEDVTRASGWGEGDWTTSRLRLEIVDVDVVQRRALPPAKTFEQRRAPAPGARFSPKVRQAFKWELKSLLDARLKFHV